jgi:Restriction endonuclease
VAIYHEVVGTSDLSGGQEDGERSADSDEFPVDSDDGMLGAVRFESLSPTDFEAFCFDLLTETGFVNVDWRKGTPKDASPADRGRDIVAHVERSDVDGHRYGERWFVDCKHYERGVPPETGEALQGTIAWAQAERPETVLFIASGYFTNGAKDWLAQYERTTNHVQTRERRLRFVLLARWRCPAQARTSASVSRRGWSRRERSKRSVSSATYWTRVFVLP